MADKRRIPETLFDDIGIRMTYEVERVIYELQTEHQHLVLFEHPFFGKMLMLDGATQVTSADEFVYHEMMAHVPIFAHGHATEVLIVGGGDCGVAEEVLKHKSVKRLTQVEIDASVVEFSKQHFPEFTKPVFADDRFDLVIADGMKYVAKTDRRFDVIIVDSTDPQGPGEFVRLEDRNAPLRDHHRAFGHAAAAGGVEFLAEQHLAGPLWVGRVDDDDVEAPIRLGHVFHAVGDDEVEAVVREHRLGEFREVLLGELDHRGVDLDLSEALDRLVLEHFLRDAAVAAADDQHLLRTAVRQDRHVSHHLVVDELIGAGDLGRAVEHQHLAEEWVLEQHEMLVLGLQLVDHPFDLVGHADADVIEQRLGNPAFFGHARTSDDGLVS